MSTILNRFVALLLLLLFPSWAAAQFPSCAPPTPVGLNANFFGMTYLSTSHVPTVPFKILRIWNTSSPNAAGWNASSNSCGTPNFTNLNTWVAQANANGQEVMWTAGRTPSCAITGGAGACTGIFAPNGCAQPPSDIDSGDTQWKNFVTALVTNSLAHTPHIKYYECVNEFNASGEWTGTMAQMVKLCGDMQTIVHTLDPAAQVWGPSSDSGNSFGVHGYSGANGYIAAGGDATYDVMNLHAYLYTGVGSTFCNNPECIQVGSGTQGSLTNYIAQARLLTSKPIGFSEGNWGCLTANTISDALKVAYLAREYLIMWGAGITNYVWYEWDSNGNPLSNACGTMAFNDVPGDISTAYQVIQTWIVGSITLTGLNPCVTTGTKTVCSYISGGVTSAQILWDTTSTPTVTVPSSYTTQHNVDGTSSAIVSHQVTLGINPIMVQ